MYSTFLHDEILHNRIKVNIQKTFARSITTISTPMDSSTIHICRNFASDPTTHPPHPILHKLGPDRRVGGGMKVTREISG